MAETDLFEVHTYTFEYVIHAWVYWIALGLTATAGLIAFYLWCRHKRS